MEKPDLRIEGGLRTRGAFHRRSEPGKPLISIITVVRNGEEHLEQTIQSVLSQTYESTEYIIIDGASSDGTLDIIRKYEDRIAYWLSEPDKGIYDAMNKGSRIASGDYALYLNADDYLYDSRSLQDTLGQGLDGGRYPLLIVGRVRLALNHELLDWFLPIDAGRMREDNPPHQATLISRTIYTKVFYNTAFRTAGDFIFWQEVRWQGLFDCKCADTVTSVFRMGGISSSKRSLTFLVKEQLLVYRYSRERSLFRLLRRIALDMFKDAVLYLLGTHIYYRHILYGVYRLRKRLLSGQDGMAVSVSE